MYSEFVYDYKYTKEFIDEIEREYISTENRGSHKYIDLGLELEFSRTKCGFRNSDDRIYKLRKNNYYFGDFDKLIQEKNS